MPRRASLIILILFLLLPAAVQAQAVIEIDTMQIDLWPEFDRSEVLVIYRFSLSDTTSLPAELTMRIPASSGGPYNLAFRDLNENGEISLFNLEYTTSQQDDWILVSFTAPTADLQFEYYDPGLQKNGDQRSFDFVWPADYTVRSMGVQIQQPINATQMQIEPDMGAGQLLQDGLTYYTGLFGEIESGEEFVVQLTYEKPDDTLSQSFEPVFPAETTADKTTFNNIWPWILGGLGVLMVLGVVIWYLVPQRKQPASARKRHVPVAPKNEKGSGNVFCTSCGTRAQPGDLFCRSCGTKLRR
jgi:hypothetical protein